MTPPKNRLAVGRFDVPRRTDNLPHPVASYRQNTISIVKSLVMQRVIDLQSGVVLFSACSSIFSSLAIVMDRISPRNLARFWKYCGKIGLRQVEQWQKNEAKPC